MHPEAAVVTSVVAVAATSDGCATGDENGIKDCILLLLLLFVALLIVP